MAKAYCPYLGTLDENNTQGSPVDYPSFENYCLVSDSNDALLLTDQATFCLAASHHYCPRYQAAAATIDLDIPFAQGEPGSGSLKSRIPEMAHGAEATTTSWAAQWGADTLDDSDLDDDTHHNRRLWGWAGAGIIFVGVFLCGAVFAAYTGWQMVNHSLLGQTTARVSTLADRVTPIPPPVYVVMTATSAPQAVNPTVITVLPLAVTPTPVVVTVQQSTEPTTDSSAVANSDPQLNPMATLPPALPPDQATAPVDLQVEVPTRRETPFFDLPTSTPVEGEATTSPSTPILPTSTATPPSGTPVVQFGSLEDQVDIHKCTAIRWHVQNVQSVYYENQPVQGDGQQEECIKEKPVTYKLAIVLFDGSTKVYSTTVMPLFPTRTPSPTPSFTPEVIPTETWTPEPPPATPTPNVHYATTLAIDGGEQHSCALGNTCEIGVLVTNSGDTSDNISLVLAQSGAWPAQLCRMDGVCSDNSLPLNGMGPGNTAYAKLVLKIPTDATSQTIVYGLRSISNGSNGSVMSNVVTVAVEGK